ncbi:MAG TPA: hypothetical protein GXZ30_14160, partial [Propionibacterium sp.]|nr:hypothetical protein [Propionibacterium sp.]
IRRAAAWRLCTELVRRHPHLRLFEEHAGGGLYDELVIRDPTGSNLNIRCNIEGNIHVFTDRDVQLYAWMDYVTADPSQFVKRVEAAAGLAAPATMPASIPSVIVYRVLAELMTRNVFKVTDLSLEHGFLDSSDDCGPRTYLFAAFPGTNPAGGLSQLASIFRSPIVSRCDALRISMCG